MPWNDRLGRFSSLKAIVFAACFLPGLWILWQWQTGAYLPRPLTEVIHATGEWSIRFLILALAVTPARHILDWSKLIAVRRMIGVTSLVYALIHLVFYVADLGGDIARAATEIVLRFYLTIGFVALLGLVALGATSTDGMIKRLGAARWRRLHWLVHPIAALGVLHFFLQSKLDASEATLMAGFLIMLWLYRQLVKWRLAMIFPALGAAALLGSALTVALEALWYGLATKVPASLILQANFMTEVEIRPAVWVLTVGLVVAAAGGVRHWKPGPLIRPRRRLPAAAPAPAQ